MSKSFNLIFSKLSVIAPCPVLQVQADPSIHALSNQCLTFLSQLQLLFPNFATHRTFHTMLCVLMEVFMDSSSRSLEKRSSLSPTFTKIKNKRRSTPLTLPFAWSLSLILYLTLLSHCLGQREAWRNFLKLFSCPVLSCKLLTPHQLFQKTQSTWWLKNSASKRASQIHSFLSSRRASNSSPEPI